MKVLVLATKYFGLGGAEAYTRMFVDACTAEGAEVDILSFLDGELVDRTSSGTYLGHSGARSNGPTQARFVAAALRRGRGYDLVVCSHVSVSPVAHILHRLFQIPYVVLTHGIEIWGALGARRQSALRHAARVVAVSRFTARRIIAQHHVLEERMMVIHPVVDPALLRLVPEEDIQRAMGSPVVFLTVARLSAEERYKGCDAVISVLLSVGDALGPVRYAIVGDGDDRARLEALAREHGASPFVEFLGRVAPEDLAAQYVGCDVFVMPSTAVLRPDGWTGEGFGIVYLEAAAFRRPVIAGAGGGAPEAIQDGVTGVIADGNDLRGLATTMIRLGRDAALRARMGAAGRARVLEQFTFARFRREAAAIFAVGRSA